MAKFNDKKGNSNSINDVTNKIKKVDKLKDISPKLYADEGGYADQVAKSSEKLKSSQLRKFFGVVKKLENQNKWEEIEPEFYLLKPQLAAAKGRKNIPGDFYKFMMICMRKVDEGSEEDKVENFKTFIKFFESIVAYHRFYYKIK